MKKVFKKIYIATLGIVYYLLLPISVVFYFFEKDTWLISERGDEARDNGYYFYRYLKISHPDVKVKYVISKKSSDINMINRSDIIYYRSIKHFLYFINSKYLLSTHYIGVSPHFKLFALLKNKKILYYHGKFIFLQHGIIYNYLENVSDKAIDLFITSSDIEKKFIIDKYNYSDKIVKCTGLARYDYFNNESENFILIMPTWRRWLNKLDTKKFVKTEYFSRWNQLINNKYLCSILEKKNLKVIFYPHYEMQRFVNCFDINKNIVIADSKDYYIHDLLDKCKLFITDFSSTSFDISYLKKPLIYYQFDYEKFYGKHYKEGYMTLSKNGFGSVCNDEENLIKNIENIINNDYKIESKYLNRIKKFYKFDDANNCERIYNEIIKL